jgi:hypothetical protein
MPGRLGYHGVFRRGMLVLADRYFSGHPQVARIASTGAGLIVRVQHRRRLPVLKELADGSYLSVLPHSASPRRPNGTGRAGPGPDPSGGA